MERSKTLHSRKQRRKEHACKPSFETVKAFITTESSQTPASKNPFNANGVAGQKCGRNQTDTNELLIRRSPTRNLHRGTLLENGKLGPVVGEQSCRLSAQLGSIRSTRVPRSPDSAASASIHRYSRINSSTMTNTLYRL